MNSTVIQRRPPVPFRLRRLIGALLDQGKAADEIAMRLGCEEIAVHQVIAQREHIAARTNPSAHQAATRKFLAQISRLANANSGGERQC